MKGRGGDCDLQRKLLAQGVDSWGSTVKHQNPHPLAERAFREHLCAVPRAHVSERPECRPGTSESEIKQYMNKCKTQNLKCGENAELRRDCVGGVGVQLGIACQVSGAPKARGAQPQLQGHVEL